MQQMKNYLYQFGIKLKALLTRLCPEKKRVNKLFLSIREKLKKRKPLVSLKLRRAQGIVLVVFLVVASFFLGRMLTDQTKGSKEIRQSNYSKIIRVDQKVELPAEGVEEAKVEVTFTTAEKTDQVVVDDKVIKAKEDKRFLIINFEIDNKNLEKVAILPAEVIRLVNEKEKKFAPDLHNNRIEILPDSTKVDRVGFVVSREAKDLKLQVGPLAGEKKIITLSF